MLNFCHVCLYVTENTGLTSGVRKVFDLVFLKNTGVGKQKVKHAQKKQKTK